MYRIAMWQYIYRPKECIMMRKKVLAILVSTVICIVGVGFGVSFFTGPTPEEIALAREAVERRYYEEASAEDKLLFPITMNEAQMQNTIHHMSHQKVEADEKWGSILITQARIGMLIDIVKEHENKWEDSDLYLDILNRWYKGDFSQADKDHNAIWKLKGGTIGEAKGLLNAKEEEKFILDRGL